MNEKLLIRSRSHDYPVIAILDANQLVSSINKIPDAKIIVDSTIFEIYPDILNQLDADQLIIASSESKKQLATVSEICEWLVAKNASKKTNLIGIGGGVIQDLCTFTANIFHRGIPYHLYPTTLLSQSDSCIGAKCALNTISGKNQLGVIYPPASVSIWPRFLESLKIKEIRSGYGEILKLSLTGENQFYQYFKSYIEHNGIDKIPETELIFKSLKAKKPIIEKDEYDNNLRRVLNFGHSFGHALETLSEHHIVHGDAIVVGMDLINFVGVKIGITPEEFAHQFRNIVYKYFSHITISKEIVARTWVQELMKDKKTTHNKINFAFVEDVGNIVIKSVELNEDLISIVEEYLRSSALVSV